jgi:hypothetical protein
MRFKKVCLLLISSVLFCTAANAQGLLQGGTVSGNFQVDVQSYFVDTTLGITEESIAGKRAAMNGFGNITYTNGKFTAGVRYEAFLPQLEGYRPDMEGHGIAHRYMSYTDESFDITVGNFYGQFGNGLIFRAYEEWNLGFDNAMNGVKVGFAPVQGVRVTGVYGTQRVFWEKYEDQNRGIVRGVDLAVSVNDIVKKLSESKTRINIGGSFVSKYQKADPLSDFVLPENVGAFAGRFDITRGGFNLQSEYAYKMNDPNTRNNWIYRPGQALLATATYSVKGFGVYVTAKRVDNMNFKSDNKAGLNDLDINYLPTIAKEHTYALGTLYPYATYNQGEMGLSGSIFYKIPKKSALGGKYGMLLTLSYSRVNAIEKNPSEGETEITYDGTYGYESPFFAIGDQDYFEDITLEFNKKINKKWKMNGQLSYIKYNMSIIEEAVETDHPHYYYAKVGVLDVTYKIAPKKAIRGEFQALLTEEDRGNWLYGGLEYSVAPHWSFTIIDQINFNKPTGNTIHYYMGGLAYVKNTTRIEAKYGRTNEGLLCVGGVCRQVPASSGLTVTITSSF